MNRVDATSVEDAYQNWANERNDLIRQDLEQPMLELWRHAFPIFDSLTRARMLSLNESRVLVYPPGSRLRDPDEEFPF